MTFNESSSETSFEPTTKDDLSALQEQVERPDPIEKYGVLIVESENHPEYLQYLKQKEAYEQIVLKHTHDAEQVGMWTEEYYNKLLAWNDSFYPNTKYGEIYWLAGYKHENRMWPQMFRWLSQEQLLLELIREWDNAIEVAAETVQQIEKNTWIELSEKESKERIERLSEKNKSNWIEAEKFRELVSNWIKTKWYYGFATREFKVFVYPPEKTVLVRTPHVDKQLELIENWYNITLDGIRWPRSQEARDTYQERKKNSNKQEPVKPGTDKQTETESTIITNLSQLSTTNKRYLYTYIDNDGKIISNTVYLMNGNLAPENTPGAVKFVEHLTSWKRYIWWKEVSRDEFYEQLNQ